MSEQVEKLTITLSQHGDAEKAKAMSKYMKNLFPFLGIQKPLRAKLQKEFILKSKTLSSEEIKQIALELWLLPEREYQYICLDMLSSCHKKWDETYWSLFIGLAAVKSWWDTVDLIASGLIGKIYLQDYLKNGEEKILELSLHDSIWLNRIALLFQLHYKQNTNLLLLFTAIENCKGKKDFFIQKAIGWALRQLSYTNPDIVISYTETKSITALAKREGLKAIVRKKNIV